MTQEDSTDSTESKTCQKSRAIFKSDHPLRLLKTINGQLVSVNRGQGYVMKI